MSKETPEYMITVYKERVRLYQEARKRLEARYEEEYDSQDSVYMSGITDGLVIAIGIIDRTLAGE